MDILTLFVVVPALTALALFLTKDLKQSRIVAMSGMVIQLAMALNLLRLFFKEKALHPDVLMHFTRDITWFDALNIHYVIGVDGISVLMIILTATVGLAGVFISWKIDDMPKEFFITFMVLAAGVFGFFISLDLFTMFVFYEIAVIPMFLLIGIWGSGPREYAAMKLTLMLMGASALLLVAILGIYFYSHTGDGAYTFNILELAKSHIPVEKQKLFFPLAFIGFGAIGALFPFHTWSPDGHASAPTAVSMLHAGVLMKLGGYGIFRVVMFLLPEGAAYWSNLFIVLTVIGVLYGALAAIKQTDLKYINAYSSVSHLGMVLFALLMVNKTAWTGAMLQSLSHGFMTALFFALIGMIYGRTHTRMAPQMGGLLKVIPFISMIYVMAGLASLGLPGMSGFVSEMNIFVGAFKHTDTFHRVMSILVVSAIVVTAVYILRVVGMMLMGPLRDESYKALPKATWFERTGIYLLMIPVLGIGLFPLWLTGLIRDSILPFIEKLL